MNLRDQAMKGCLVRPRKASGSKQKNDLVGLVLVSMESGTFSEGEASICGMLKAYA